MTDLYLKPRPEGQDLLLTNGMPTLTGGLDNMIYIQLITSDWWGNTEAKTNGLLNSKIPQIISESSLTNKTRIDIIAEAKRATAPIVTAGIAERIEIDGRIPKVGTLYLSVKVYEPGQNDALDFIYALNWDSQKITIEGGTW